MNFTLQVFLLNPQPPQTERITFAPGQSTKVVSGNLQANVPKYYVVYVAAGQQLRLLLTSNPAGSANFAINGVSDGIVYKQLTDPSRETTITAPTSQDYLITVFSSVNASYQLEVTVPTPLPPTIPAPDTHAAAHAAFRLHDQHRFRTAVSKPMGSGSSATPRSQPVYCQHRRTLRPALGASGHRPSDGLGVSKQQVLLVDAPAVPDSRSKPALPSCAGGASIAPQEAQTDNPGLGQDKQEVVLLKPDLSTVAVWAACGATTTHGSSRWST